MSKIHHLFISHAWKYNEEYDRLVNLLNSVRDDPVRQFSYKNYSVPKHDPLFDPDTEVGERKLKLELDSQISPASCVLVISGMYVPYRKWIQAEIEIAQRYRKPIIGVVPRGQERVPIEVQNVANEMVGWSTESIIAAIRRYS